ncbi:MAG: FHA domain-containing protein [Spirochaetales bacterium]
MAAKKRDLLSQDTAIIEQGDELVVRKSAKVCVGADPRLEAHGKSKRLTRKSIGIGRDRSNSVIVADERVSKFHAIISLRNGKAYIKDTGSTNGTLLNKAVLVANRDYQIAPGDALLLGSTRITIHA